MAIATSPTRGIESTDAIVLLDNAVQPKQAAPVAAMKETDQPGVGKEHWKHIWPLIRRLSTAGPGDGYDTSSRSQISASSFGIGCMRC